MSAANERVFCRDCAACFRAAQHVVTTRAGPDAGKDSCAHIGEHFHNLVSVANSCHRTVIATYAQNVANFVASLGECSLDQLRPQHRSLLAEAIEWGMRCEGGARPERCIDLNFGTLWPLIDELARIRAPEGRRGRLA
jgi:hypothetical protein